MLAFPAGRAAAKWIVFGVWLVASFAALGANLPGKFADAEKNESTSFLPGDAESTARWRPPSSSGRRAGADGRRLPARRRADAPADRRGIAADRARAHRSRALRAHDAVRPSRQLSRDGTQPRSIANDHRRRRGRTDILDPVDGYREPSATPAAGSR